MRDAVRIAAAQLVSAARSRRCVPAGPLVGLLDESPQWVLSVVLHASPGKPAVDGEVAAGLAVVRSAFADEGKRMHVELVEEASPGLEPPLVRAGLRVDARMPLLAVEPDRVAVPRPPKGTRVEFVRDEQTHAAAEQVAAAAFDSAPLGNRLPATAADGGSVLVRSGGDPVATAAWTAVSDGVTEIVGVGTLPDLRRHGLGTLATAYAVDLAVREGGATLPWLTPGDDGADRVYRAIGFRQVASCVHLGEP